MALSDHMHVDANKTQNIFKLSVKDAFHAAVHDTSIHQVITNTVSTIMDQLGVTEEYAHKLYNDAIGEWGSKLLQPDIKRHNKENYRRSFDNMMMYLTAWSEFVWAVIPPIIANELSEKEMMGDFFGSMRYDLD